MNYSVPWVALPGCEFDGSKKNHWDDVPILGGFGRNTSQNGFFLTVEASYGENDNTAVPQYLDI